jgi:hypothetical protein
MQSGKNFLGKNLQKFARWGNLYDFTYHKLHRMVDQLIKWYPDHPDLMVLNNILELYIDGDIEIYWSEGYPLAYPTNNCAIVEGFDEELFEELSDMGLFDD